MNINRTFVNHKCTNPPAGLDKLRLYTRDFQVADTRHLTIMPNYKKQGEVEVMETLLFRVGDTPVNGAKAFHNAQDGQEGQGNLAVNIDHRGLSVEFNPSKMAGKYTGELATLDDVRQELPVLESYLRDQGIMLNLSESRITRIDFAKDRVMDDCVRSYSAALSTLDGKRVKERVQYPDGVRIGSASKQGIFYDKGRQLKPKEGSTNSMRGEVRLLKGKTIKQTLGISSVRELTNLHGQDISSVYANYINSDIYRMGNAEQLSFSFTQEVEVLKFYRTHYKRNALENWVMTEGLQALMERIGGMENMEQILSSAGYSRQGVYVAKRKLETLLRQASFNQSSPQTLGIKREEIRAKFTA